MRRIITFGQLSLIWLQKGCVFLVGGQIDESILLKTSFDKLEFF